MWAIVVAAGRGERFGGPKQRELIDGRSVVDRSVSTAREACDGVVVVLPPGDTAPVSDADATVAGGATRSASVRAGLAAVPAAADVVVVHDAARPLATVQMWRAAIEAVRNGADAALCAVPVTDTIKRVHGERVVETLDRTELVAVQTPQAFRAAALRAAHGREPDATDDGALVELAGGKVVVVDGSPANIKITHPHDLRVAATLLAALS